MIFFFFFFIFQIKERNNEIGDDKKWFDNKIINKGVKQIKSTLKYLENYPEILIENEKGHKLNISNVRKNIDSKKIIIYKPNKDFSEEIRHKKFYESSEIGLIHLFHSEDYHWICKYLITPCEISNWNKIMSFFKGCLFVSFRRRRNRISCSRYVISPSSK